MTVRTNVTGATNFVLQEAIRAYADEAYTFAKKLSGTGIVGSNSGIDTSTETFTGQVRWNKPLTININTATLTDPGVGLASTYAQDYLTYIKTVRTYGAKKVNMQVVVSQEDGLAKIGRDFSEVRAQDEHNSVLSVLRGVALSEMMYGAHYAGGANGLGGQTFDNDPEDITRGFYVDLSNSVKTIATHDAANQGAIRAKGFLEAFGMAYKDYEPEYAYLVTSPETMASLRSANLVDQDGVVEGNIKFSTIFGGKFRLIQSRASQGFSTAELAKINAGTGVNIGGTKTTFIVLPGAIALENLAVPDPVEIFRDGRAYQGGGATDIWHRWGYVAHPAGYNWNGANDTFVEEGGFHAIYDGADTTAKLIANVTTPANTATELHAGTRGMWQRKVKSVLSLGILPIFHG